MPVVADPGGHRQIGAELPFVLEETADGFFDKDDSGVAALEQDGEGSVGGEVGERGVGQGAELVRAVREAPTAPVGNINAVLQGVFTDSLRDEPGDGGVKLGGESIGLGTTAGKGVADDEARSDKVGFEGSPVAGDEKAELGEQFGGEHGAMVEDGLVFAKPQLLAGGGEGGAADPAIVLPTVLKVLLQEDGLFFVELMAKAEGGDSVDFRGGHVFADRPCNALGEDDGY